MSVFDELLDRAIAAAAAQLGNQPDARVTRLVEPGDDDQAVRGDAMLAATLGLVDREGNLAR